MKAVNTQNRWSFFLCLCPMWALLRGAVVQKDDDPIYLGII